MPTMTGRSRALLYLGYGLLIALVATGALLVITRRPVGLPVQLEPPPTPLPLRVQVTGAVITPGVYRLAPGSIVQDALAAAGGTTPQADLSQLNLAHLLQDGDQVVVPVISPTSAAVPTGPANSTAAARSPTPAGSPAPVGSPAPSSGQAININTATAAELDSLPLFGPALAQRIVDYRTAHGPFRAIEDIMQVSGIGPGIFAQIKDLIRIG
jgi:competence protein ComEA